MCVQQDVTSIIEEADIRIAAHFSQAIIEKSDNIAILSNDADMVVLVLYYIEKFVRKGLQYIWIRYGLSDHTIYLRILCRRHWVQISALYR